MVAENTGTAHIFRALDSVEQLIPSRRGALRPAEDNQQYRSDFRCESTNQQLN